MSKNTLSPYFQLPFGSTMTNVKYYLQEYFQATVHSCQHKLYITSLTSTTHGHSNEDILHFDIKKNQA